MKYTDAKRLVKSVGSVKYRGTKLVVLQRFTDGLFHGATDSQDIEGREVRKKTATVLGWVKLKNPTYLMDVLRGIEEITAERHGKYLKYTMNFEPLTHLEPPDLAKEIEEFKKKDAARARKTYAKKRKEQTEKDRKKIVRVFLKGTATRKANNTELKTFVNALLQEVEQ